MASQGRNPKTGRCLCGHATGSDRTCLPSLRCVAGECVDAAPAPHPALGPKEALLLQPQLCGTADPPRANITDFWYGTAKPAANLRPELDTLRFSTLSLSPRGVGTVASWPVEVEDPALLRAAAALWATLNAPPWKAGFGAWPSLRLWRISLDQLPTFGSDLVLLADLERFSGAGAQIRDNVFRRSGPPQCGGRLKPSHSVVSGNTWE